MKKIFLILLLYLFNSSANAGLKEIGSSYVSQETKDKIGQANKRAKKRTGWFHTEEARKKIGAKHKGKKLSSTTKQKMREARVGRVTCKDASGNFLTVSKREFDNRSDLTGTTGGITKPNARIRIQCIETGECFTGIVEAGKILGVPPGQISENLKGKREKVGLKSYDGGLTFRKDLIQEKT